MNFSEISKYFLSTILLLQLSSLSYSFEFTQFSYGSFSQAKAEKKLSFESKRIAANFSGGNTSYDTMVIVGDIMLARNVEFLMEKHGPNYPFAGIDFNDFSQSTAVVGNFEASVPTVHVPTPALALNFSVSKDYIEGLRTAGFTHLSLANNHSYDYGTEGFVNTADAIKNNELQPFGHPNMVSDGSVSYIEIQDKIVSIIGIHLLNKQPKTSALREIFDKASRKSDFQVVYVHWGNEYQEKSSKNQRDWAEKFVDLGADLVVGHHPHVIQEVALVNDVPVFYSLGNYIFDQYFSTTVMNGLLLELSFDPSPAVHVIPVSSIENLSQPAYMSSEKHQKTLLELAENSDPLIREGVRSGVVMLDIPVASSPKTAMMD